jgi:hypothetical protein
LAWFGGLVWSAKLEQRRAWGYDQAELFGYRPDFRDFLTWYGLAMCFYLPNLNKLSLGDMIRQSFLVRGLIAGIF